MKIPIRYYYLGNLVKAKSLIGLGKKVLSKLEHSISFNALPTGQTSLKLGDGSIIYCTINYGIREVHIYTPLIDIRKRKILDKVFKECFCNCFFTLGYIIGLSVSTPEYPIVDDRYEAPLYPNDNRRWDVTACLGKDEYAIFKYCLPSDQLDWEAEVSNYGMESVEGMPIILLIDNARLDHNKCCPYEDEEGVSQTNSITQTACDPTIPEYEDLWLQVPVYKFVPIFPSALSKWKENLSVPPINTDGKIPNGFKIDNP